MISSVSGSMSSYEEWLALQAERAASATPFQENDANEDGSLDVEEFTSLVGQMSEMTGQEVDAEELFASLDTDEDGQLSEEEFEAGRPQGPPPGPPPEMTSDSGSELQTLLAMLSSSEESEDEGGYFDSLDVNEDGVVDAEELKAGMNKLIEAYQQQEGYAFNQSSEAQSGLNLMV